MTTSDARKRNAERAPADRTFGRAVEVALAEWERRIDEEVAASPRAHVEALVEVLEVAGLLATEAHDAQVAAQALRGAAEELHCYADRTPTPTIDRAVARWLDARADRIEAGDSDADA